MQLVRRLDRWMWLNLAALAWGVFLVVLACTVHDRGSANDDALLAALSQLHGPWIADDRPGIRCSSSTIGSAITPLISLAEIGVAAPRADVSRPPVRSFRAD